MAKIVVECTDPNDLEALEEAADQMAGRCNVTYFRQAAEMVDKGIAKSQYDAAKQIASQSGETVKAVEHRISRGKKEVPQGGEQEANPVISGTSGNLEKLEKTWGGSRPGAGRKPLTSNTHTEPAQLDSEDYEDDKFDDIDTPMCKHLFYHNKLDVWMCQLNPLYFSEDPDAFCGGCEDFIAEAEEAEPLPLEEPVYPSYNHRAQGTGENEWYTPPEFIEKARKVMGGIDLDPATSAQANITVGADKIYTVQDDGLSYEWQGKIWLNPPYSQPAISNFANKMVNEWRSGRVTSAVVLTHNYTDTRWFHTLASACTAICFTKGRIAFVNQDGEKAAPTQGQAFFYFGDNIGIFSQHFQDCGLVVEVLNG